MFVQVLEPSRSQNRMLATCYSAEKACAKCIQLVTPPHLCLPRWTFTSSCDRPLLCILQSINKLDSGRPRNELNTDTSRKKSPFLCLAWCRPQQSWDPRRLPATGEISHTHTTHLITHKEGGGKGGGKGGGREDGERREGGGKGGGREEEGRMERGGREEGREEEGRMERGGREEGREEEGRMERGGREEGREEGERREGGRKGGGREDGERRKGERKGGGREEEGRREGERKKEELNVPQT